MMLFFSSPHSCSLYVHMQKCTSKQGKVGALHLGLWVILTALLECLHFFSRWGSLPRSKTFSGAFEDAQSASFQKVIGVINIASVHIYSSAVNQCYVIIYTVSLCCKPAHQRKD